MVFVVLWADFWVLVDFEACFLLDLAEVWVVWPAMAGGGATRAATGRAKTSEAIRVRNGLTEQTSEQDGARGRVDGHRLTDSRLTLTVGIKIAT